MKVTDEMSRIRILIQSRIGAGSVSQRFGSEDPDPLVRGMDPDPDPDPAIIMANSKKISEKIVLLKN